MLTKAGATSATFLQLARHARPEERPGGADKRSFSPPVTGRLGTSSPRGESSQSARRMTETCSSSELSRRCRLRCGGLVCNGMEHPPRGRMSALTLISTEPGFDTKIHAAHTEAARHPGPAQSRRLRRRGRAIGPALPSLLVLRPRSRDCNSLMPLSRWLDPVRCRGDQGHHFDVKLGGIRGSAQRAAEGRAAPSYLRAGACGAKSTLQVPAL